MEMDSHMALEEEECLNMEITPHSSSPLSQDFEFQPLSSSASSSAASDLFYRGRLLPLHIRRPPPFLSAPCTTSNSCNISPSESCRPSFDLNPTDIVTFFFNNNSSSNPPRNNSWSKMKLNKRSYLAHKLKSSRAFLKSLFTKHSSKAHPALIKKNVIDDHRRSFSGAIASDSSSSSSSFNSSALHEVQFLRRSNSAAEIEASIDAAIAHCKKSFPTISSVS